MYDLEVPEEGFDMLLQVAEGLDNNNDKKLIQTIKKNIPKKYNFNNFSIEFVKELLECDTVIDDSIIIWDFNTGLKEFKGQYSVFSPDYQKLEYYDDVIIWDMNTGQITKPTK